jgi:hypothetical protein
MTAIENCLNIVPFQPYIFVHWRNILVFENHTFGTRTIYEINV